MKVQFRSPDAAGARLRRPAVQRVRTSLRWLQGFVQRVHMQLEDVNGPAPGVDKRCQVSAQLPGGREARIAATSRSWSQAVELATQGLRQQILLQLRGSVVAEARAAGALHLRPARR